MSAEEPRFEPPDAPEDIPAHVPPTVTAAGGVFEPREAGPVIPDERVAVPSRAAWIFASALLAALGLLVFVVWQGQAGLSRSIASLDRRFAELTERAGQAAVRQAALDARLRAIEEKVGSQIDVAVLAKAVLPSVFTIESDVAQGSGFVVERHADGSTLLTNAHVVQSVGEGGRVRVRQEGRRTLRGTVLRIDDVKDLATVRVGSRIAPLSIDQTVPTVGEPVVVFGSPLGLEGTVTSGIVSGGDEDLIQFSAPVSPGNSGGPVVDRHGKVIGVAVLKVIGFGAEGLSFAVPISDACSQVLRC